ncbi:MAG: MCE family protein, partial [Mycobacterium sp.]
MRENLRGALWRLAVYAFVCVLGAFALIAVFAQLRFQSEKTYTAQFANVSGLEGGNFVRIAGVEVGKVKSIDIQPDSTVLVKFTAADNVVLTEGTRAAIRFADLIGGRYVALEEGAGAVKRLHPGETIPLSRTEPALDLDALIGGFRPLFRALDPEQVNKLTGQLIAAFQGQGATIGSFL